MCLLLPEIWNNIGTMKYFYITTFFVMLCSVLIAQVVLPAYQGTHYTKEFSCGAVLNDSRDGSSYNTININGLCWMQENLKYLPSVVPAATGSTTTAYYYVMQYYGTDVSEAKATSNYTTYGVLYNWPASLNACPSGWRLPTDAEFRTLFMYLGMSAAEANSTGYIGTNEGSKLSSDASLWGASSAIASNPGFGTSGFNNLPAGYRRYTGIFNNLGLTGNLWTSTEDSGDVYLFGSVGTLTQASRGASYKEQGFSVRCIKD